MNTSRHMLWVALAAALAACAEPGNETVEATPASSLAGVQAAHYAVVRVEDGALFAAQIGANETACGDRTLRRECLVRELDLSRLDLTAEDEELARARVTDGSAVVRAKLGPGDRLVATDLWMRAAASPTLTGARASAERMFVLRDVHEGCAEGASACAWLRVEPLSGAAASHHAGIDASLVGGSIDETTRQAIARGEVLAHGAAIGRAFVLASLYVPFPARTAPAPVSPPPTTEPPPVR